MASCRSPQFPPLLNRGASPYLPGPLGVICDHRGVLRLRGRGSRPLHTLESSDLEWQEDSQARPSDSGTRGWSRRGPEPPASALGLNGRTSFLE